MGDPAAFEIFCPICSEPAPRQEGRMWRFQCETPECNTRFTLQVPKDAALALAHREALADAARKREDARVQADIHAAASVRFDGATVADGHS